MKDIIEYIKSLGGLHDANLIGFLWNSNKERLEIEFYDIHSNFLDLPEYQGLQKGTFLFSGVICYETDVNWCNEGLSVYKWTITRSDNGIYKSEISFSPGGRVFVEAREIILKKS